MIKRLGFSNFYSFKEYSELSFEYDNNVPEDISKGLPYGTVLGIKGGNGSGKTNIIKAIKFFYSFCLDKFSHFGTEEKNTSKIIYSNFFDNENHTEFDIEFLIDDVTYVYELKMKKNIIFNEKVIKKVKRSATIIERLSDGQIKCTQAYSELKNIQLRDNQSIISVIDKFKFSNDMTELKLLNKQFRNLLSNVDSKGYKEIDSNVSLNTISRAFRDHEDIFKFAKNVVKLADSGITDIVLKSRLDENGDTVYYPVFIHEHGGKKYEMLFNDESSGTKSLYKKIAIYYFAIETGGLLALDEFDIHLHANLLPYIVNLFLDPEINKNNAQFIFTAHNTEIIDTLGRYRTILVNKEDNESYCYRLDEIKGTMLRNGRAISPIYKEGKIGGVPNVFMGNKEL